MRPPRYRPAGASRLLSADRGDGRVGVHRRAAAGMDLEVGVRGTAARVAGVADVPDHLALLDVARRTGVRVEVEVVVEGAVVSVQPDALAGDRAVLLDDVARHDGDVRRPARGHDVDPLVRPRVTAWRTPGVDERHGAAYRADQPAGDVAPDRRARRRLALLLRLELLLLLGEAGPFRRGLGRRELRQLLFEGGFGLL